MELLLMADAFNRLFLHVIQSRPRLRRDRFPLDLKPVPFPVCLDEDEARILAPLYLANVFVRRDIARVNVNQVMAWLFKARIEIEATGGITLDTVSSSDKSPMITTSR